MAFGVGIVAIWHCEQVGLKEAEHLIEVVFEQGEIHLGDGSISSFRAHFNVIGQEAFHQSHTYLAIGKVERVETRSPVVVLDGHITALIEQWSDGAHVFGRSIEGRRKNLHLADSRWHYIELPQHLNKECRSA